MRAALQARGDSEAHLLAGVYQRFSRHSYGSIDESLLLLIAHS